MITQPQVSNSESFLRIKIAKALIAPAIYCRQNEITLRTLPRNEVELVSCANHRHFHDSFYLFHLLEHGQLISVCLSDQIRDE